MSDLPPFPRDMLAAAFNGNQRMVGAFERLIQALTEAVAKAETAAGAAGVVDTAAFLLAAASGGLPGARVLVPGDGISLVDGGTSFTISASEVLPRIEGGYPVHFVVTADTNLILPVSGQLATINDANDLVSGSVTSFNGRTGAVVLLSADVTAALGYTPTSVTGLTGIQSVAAFKTGLSLVKGDVGLGNVDNTADAVKVVLSASKLTTARTISITGDATWTSGAFDGSANVTAALTLATVNASPGSFGGASKSLTATVNGKGLITSLAEQAIAITASQVSGLAAIATSGSASDLSAGTVAAARMPALTGDITTAAGAVATTLATVNSNVGTFGSATQVATFTVNAKGLVTAAANVTITPAVGSITGLGTGVAAWLATPSSANLASAITDETGSGALVFATSPALVTPLLGTPTSGTLTNCTGLPISSGVSGLGTGIATFLATPSSANLLAALTTSTGTGNAVFSASPTFTGTITAAALNASGLVKGTSGARFEGAVTGAGTGAGIEISGSNITGFNRTTAAYINVSIDTANLNIRPQGGNIGLGAVASAGGGVLVVFIANATTLPTSNPTGGGILYVDSGALKWRGSAGTVTTIAAA